MKEITPEHRDILREFNNAVEVAIRNRREWLDKNMAQYADVQVGEDLYDLQSSARVGMVIAHRRYWRNQHEGVMDTSLSCYYEYVCETRGMDNTSRQMGRSFGSRAQALERAQSRILALVRHPKTS